MDEIAPDGRRWRFRLRWTRWSTPLWRPVDAELLPSVLELLIAGRCRGALLLDVLWSLTRLLLLLGLLPLCAIARTTLCLLHVRPWVIEARTVTGTPSFVWVSGHGVTRLAALRRRARLRVRRGDFDRLFPAESGTAWSSSRPAAGLPGQQRVLGAPTRW